MLERVYVEISNICNLSCSFCTGTNRPKSIMSEDEFAIVCKKLNKKAKFIYLHVLGEPLLHPNFNGILNIARQNNLKVCITTNGTLLSQRKNDIYDNADIIHKISISLHALEGNNFSNQSDYLKTAADFAKEASKKGIFIVFRLWNKDSSEAKGANNQNKFIEEFLHTEFNEEWSTRPQGFRLKKNIFLEYDGVFTWPTDSKAEKSEQGFCYGLSNQAAILADGTVVPCCLDANGEIPLGNIFNATFDEILNSDRAKKIREGFSSGIITEELCKKCTFARKFKKRNN